MEGELGVWETHSNALGPKQTLGWGRTPREPATGHQEVGRGCLCIEPIKAL